MALGGSGIVIAACFAVFLLHRWSSSSSSSAQPSENLSAATTKVPSPTASPSIASSPSPIESPQAKPTNPTASKAESTVSSASIASASVGRQGILRISNPTEYPVRVALLAKRTQENSSPSAEKTSGYELPAHWDFEPQEGGEKGLIVSLPNRNLKVKKGDILVAFAQDGSRRYWGPYVVGETELPIWNPKGAEWQLILQP
jgi:hypothetical protein